MEQTQPQQHPKSLLRNLDFLGLVYYGIFGILFIIYESDSKYYNDCKKQQFLYWSIFTAALCIFCAIESAFKVIVLVFKIKHDYEKLCELIETLATILVIACVIGLSIVDEDSCGSLHTLVKVFYIMSYVIMGTAPLIACCACCCLKELLTSGRKPVASQDESHLVHSQDQKINLASDPSTKI